MKQCKIMNKNEDNISSVNSGAADDQRYTSVIDPRAAVVNHGNIQTLREVFARAQQGEPLTVAFLGGSITHGSLASSPETCYAYRVYEGIRNRFPQADVKYVNAGIGGTDSQFGVARVSDDVLRYDPDLVFIEFSVNDEEGAHAMETYEGLVRRVLSFRNSRTGRASAIVLIHNMYYDDGKSAEACHVRVGKYYDLPCLSIKSSIYPAVAAGKIPKAELTPDGLHPNDTGHGLIAGVILDFLHEVMDEATDQSQQGTPMQREDLGRVQHSESADKMNTAADMTAVNSKEAVEGSKRKFPLTENDYENSVRRDNRNSTPALEGFVKNPARQQGITDCFKNGWYASKRGDRIRFETEGSSLAVQFRQTIQGSAPVARATVDGVEEKAVLLDANFDETWGDNLKLVTLAEHIEGGKHQVKVEIVKEAEGEKTMPFELISVISSGKI